MTPAVESEDVLLVWLSKSQDNLYKDVFIFVICYFMDTENITLKINSQLDDKYVEIIVEKE